MNIRQCKMNQETELITLNHKTTHLRQYTHREHKPRESINDRAHNAKVKHLDEEIEIESSKCLTKLLSLYTHARKNENEHDGDPRSRDLGCQINGS